MIACLAGETAVFLLVIGDDGSQLADIIDGSTGWAHPPLRLVTKESIHEHHLGSCKKIVVEQLSCEEDKVVPEASFIDDLGADSLDTVELVMAFEEEFDIEIPDDVAETIQTVADAVSKIEEHAN